VKRQEDSLCLSAIQTQAHCWADERQEVWQFLVCTTLRGSTWVHRWRNRQETPWGLRFNSTIKQIWVMICIRSNRVKKADVKPERKPSMAIASTPKTTSYPSVTSHPSPAAWLNETVKVCSVLDWSYAVCSEPLEDNAWMFNHFSRIWLDFKKRLGELVRTMHLLQWPSLCKSGHIKWTPMQQQDIFIKTTFKHT